jgi:hypothetical protein
MTKKSKTRKKRCAWNGGGGGGPCGANGWGCGRREQQFQKKLVDGRTIYETKKKKKKKKKQKTHTHAKQSPPLDT